MTLQEIITAVEAYERKLPYNIRYQVGQDHKLVWIRAWELRWGDRSLEPQRRFSQKTFVMASKVGYFGPAPSDVYEACFEAAQDLMERL